MSNNFTPSLGPNRSAARSQWLAGDVVRLVALATVPDQMDYSEANEGLPDCLLLPANIFDHISKVDLSVRCYSFPVGFFS